MRVRFFQPTTEGETAERLALERRIDDFWFGFVETVRPLRSVRRPASSELDTLARRLSEDMGSVAPGLVVELDALDSGYRVVIAPARDESLVPTASLVLSRAPSLGGLELCLHRPRLSPESAFAAVRRSLGVDLSTARARAGFSRGHLLDVVVYSPEFSSSRDERALAAATAAAARLIGKERFDAWVGSVDVAPGARPGPLRLADARAADGDRFDLADLGDVVERAVEAVRANLSEAPYHEYCERAEWTMLELEPEPIEGTDYAAADDLVLSTTMLPEMMKCFLEGERFSSGRFSKNGERFCYLKIDAAGASPQDKLERRLALEDALNLALVPGRVGCVVAAGLGLRYFYVGLALSQLEAGIDIVVRACQKLGVGERAWLLFCDSVWAREWIGLRPTTAAPP